MARVNYYEILGIHRNATATEIKQAFRKLALRFHPDRNPEDPEAEARFKEIAEAYEVLSDPARRAEYDRGGRPQARARAADVDLRAQVDELFREIFGDIFGGRSPRGPRPQRGADLRYRIQVDLAEAVEGGIRDLEIPARTLCRSCGGTGARPGTPRVACPECRGHGTVRFQQGFFHVEKECPVCAGDGRVPESPCPACGGRGAQEVVRRLQVRIPPGVQTGDRLRVAGEGEAGQHGGPPGDLYVVVEVRDHPLFQREGSDLVCEVPISFAQAALGAVLEVPTLSGGTVKVKVPPGTQPGAEFSVPGQGIPRKGGGRGALRVRVRLEVPEKVEGRARELLKEWARLEAEDPGAPYARFRSRFLNGGGV
ncbi:molecular chaperone DnaJ [Deferrisoma palaeochoriense]